VPWF